MHEAPLYCATGIPEAYRDEAGRIVYDAFRRKLQPLLGAPAQIERLLAADLQLDTAIGAFIGERLAGLACLSEGGPRATRVPLRDFTQRLGPLRGLYSWLALGIFELSHCPRGELRLAILAVDGALRGRGVGARLLEAVFAYAERRGLGAVRLDVVDTNVGARQLYERAGFVPVRTVPVLPLFPGWLGFASAIEMVRPLISNPATSCATAGRLGGAAGPFEKEPYAPDQTGFDITPGQPAAPQAQGAGDGAQ